MTQPMTPGHACVSCGQPDTGKRCNHVWDEHGACRNCSAIDFDQADNWRPPSAPSSAPLAAEQPPVGGSGWVEVEERRTRRTTGSPREPHPGQFFWGES
jgi:hypothetical protein